MYNRTVPSLACSEKRGEKACIYSLAVFHDAIKAAKCLFPEAEIVKFWR